jgi:hypothetical protein
MECHWMGFLEVFNVYNHKQVKPNDPASNSKEFILFQPEHQSH